MHVLNPLGMINISFFFYIKILESGHYIALSNHQKFLEHHYRAIDHQGVFFDKINRSADDVKLVCSLWPTEPPTEPHDFILETLRKFDIWNGISLVKRMPGSIERFCFAGSNHAATLGNFYMNNMGLLKRFLLYFKEKTHMLVSSFNQSNMAKFQQHVSIAPLNLHTPDQDRSLLQFLDNIRPKQTTFIHGRLGLVKLSPQENECMKHLSMGKTAKKIAQEMSLSQRTVESYINNVKFKTGYEKRTDMVVAYLKSQSETFPNPSISLPLP